MKVLIYSKEDLDLILNLEIDKKDKEIERLNNIINELEKWAKEHNGNNRDIYGYETEEKILDLEDFLDKLKELKEGK